MATARRYSRPQKGTRSGRSACVSKNIEAGSTSVEKPNAIVLDGSVLLKWATRPLNRSRCRRCNGPEASPPKPFDVTRKLNVFWSKLDSDLGKSDHQSNSGSLRRNRQNRRTIDNDGRAATIKVDDKWLKGERKRIEDTYAYQIKNFGRLILYMAEHRHRPLADLRARGDGRSLQQMRVHVVSDRQRLGLSPGDARYVSFRWPIQFPQWGWIEDNEVRPLWRRRAG